MADTSSILLETALPEHRHALLPQLVKLLQDVVSGGAAVGFLSPLSDEEAQAYWHTVLDEVSKQTRILLVAYDTGIVVGAIQLALVTRTSALHRGEIQKLLVLQSQRRQGIGRYLMQSIERIAYKQGRTLLVLDTRQGEIAEQLYRKLGYIEVGPIPGYALSATGELHTTVVFYKQLIQE